MINLKGFRQNATSLADLLPYACLIDDGIILNKDGSLMTAWEYKGQDTASSTIEEIVEISRLFEQMIRELDSGFMLQADAIRKETTHYPEAGRSYFPDKISQMIEDERRNFFEHVGECYQTNTVFTLTYKVETELNSSKAIEVTLKTFKEAIEKIESFMPVIPGFIATRLTDYEFIDEYNISHRYSGFLSHLKQCISGDLQPLLIPESGMYLDSLLGGNDLQNSQHLTLDNNKHIMALSIDGLPSASQPDILGVLDILPINYRFSSRFIFLDRFEAEKAISNQQKAWNQQTMRFIDKYTNASNPKMNWDAVNMVNDSELALTDLKGGEKKFGYLSSVVILMAEDLELLKKQSLIIKSEIEARGFSVRLETYNTFEAWLGSLPGNCWANVRRPLISTKNLPHLLLLSSVWAGDDRCLSPFFPDNSPPLMVCTTNGSTPFRFNIYHGDLGHTLIFGPTGSGKSTLLALMVAQYKRYENATIFAFDKGMSLFPICQATGGDHYNIGGEIEMENKEKKLSFAPLSNIDESKEEFAWASNWVETLLTLRNFEVLPIHTNLINKALNNLKNQPKNQRSLTNLYHAIQDIDLRNALEHYTNTGAMGHLLDAETDNLKLSNFMVFEIEELMEMGEQNLIPVLLYIFRRIEKALQGQPCILVLDEAWIMLGHPVFRNKIREWLKTLRKANCGVIMATQSLADATDSGIMHVLEESCPTKVFLANYQADSPSQLASYRGLGLNDAQINIIKTAISKHDYYVVTPRGRRLMQLALGKIALSFVGASSKEDISDIQKLSQEYGEKWPYQWLAERNVSVPNGEGTFRVKN